MKKVKSDHVNRLNDLMSGCAAKLSAISADFHRRKYEEFKKKKNKKP